MVQHEDRAGACEDWSQQVVRTGEVKRFQPGADNGVAEQFHRGRGQPVGVLVEISQRPLKKRLAG
jgi:hypothetical protein